MIIGMTWTRHIDKDETVYWATKIGLTHVNVVKEPDAARRVYVWASEYPDVGWDLVHRDWSIPAAKAWAEKEYS